MCEEVATLDVQRMENAKNWSVITYNYNETFIDRVWNDPEFQRVYNAHVVVVKKLESQTDFLQYASIIGECNDSPTTLNLFRVLGGYI